AGGHLAFGRADDEAPGRDLCGLHEHLARGHLQPPLGGSLDGRLLVDEKQGTVRQRDAPPLAGGGVDLLTHGEPLWGYPYPTPPRPRARRPGEGAEGTPGREGPPRRDAAGNGGRGAWLPPHGRPRDWNWQRSLYGSSTADSHEKEEKVIWGR